MTRITGGFVLMWSGGTTRSLGCGLLSSDGRQRKRVGRFSTVCRGGASEVRPSASRRTDDRTPPATETTIGSLLDLFRRPRLVAGLDGDHARPDDVRHPGQNALERPFDLPDPSERWVGEVEGAPREVDQGLTV